jgi:hypothetical protein
VVTVPTFAVIRSRVQEAGEISRSALAASFSHHIRSSDIDACLDVLVSLKEVRLERHGTFGRPRVWLIWQGEPASTAQQADLPL